MIVNIWLGVSDNLQSIARASLRWDEDTQGEYDGPLRNRSRRLFEYIGDEAVRTRLFNRPTLQGTRYNLWSLDFDDQRTTLLKVEEEIAHLATQFPSEISILGAWKRNGAMVGCQLTLTEVPNPDYVGEPYWIANPAYQPDPEQPDYDPRENIRNPAYVPATITERSQTGTPRHPIPNYLWRFLPNPLPDETVPTSNADLTDINVALGQKMRIFS